MTRPITKRQFEKLWSDEFYTNSDETNPCVLCNGSGMLENRLGLRQPCICPNGRHRKKYE